jgi:enoyl-CoA hydratase/carnithine racemase
MALVTTTITDGIAQVRLHRPDKLNALTLDLLAELVATARELGRDRSLRAVVLAGEGGSFCPGRGGAPTPSRRRRGPGAGSRCR